MSFIEQVSLNHISPWLGGGEAVDGNGNANGSANGVHPPPGGGGVVPECKVLFKASLNLTENLKPTSYY